MRLAAFSRYFIVVSLLLLAPRLWAQPGSLDLSFAQAGGGPDNLVECLAVQNDGKVIIGGGFSNSHGQPRANLARLNADGTLDLSFTPPSFSPYVFAIAIQADGKILVGGSFTSVRNRIARLNADGTLDNSFGQVGLGLDNSVRAIAVQSDGKIIVSGEFENYNTPSSIQRGKIARLNADGTLDNTFTTPNPGFNGVRVTTLAIQSDGKILAGGNFFQYGATARGNLARLNSDGTLDSFTSSISLGPLSAVVLQSDGNILVAGNVTNRIARLLANGMTDAAFNTNVAALALNAGVNSVAFQSNGKIIIGGSFSTPPRNNIMRMNADGTIDASFGPTMGGVNGSVNAMFLQTDGKIVIGGGFGFYNAIPRLRIARINGGEQYTWDGSAGTDWQNPANWTPDRTTPAVTDVLQFPSGGPWTPTNIPSQTLGGLIIDNSTVTLRGASSNIQLTVINPGNSAVLQGAAPVLNLGGVNGNADNPVTITMAAGATFIVGGTSTLNVSTAAIRGAGNFIMLASVTGRFITSRADGINGISQNTGSIQCSGMVNYDMGNKRFEFRGLPGIDQTANMQAVGTKPAVIAVTNLGKTGPNTLFINSNLTVSQAFVPATIDGTIEVMQGVTFGYLTNGPTLNPAATLRVRGTLNAGASTTVNDGTIEVAGGSITGAGLFTYSAASRLIYSGAGNLTAGPEFPTGAVMPADVYVQKSSGILTLQLAGYTINRNMYVSSPVFVPYAMPIPSSITINSSALLEVQNGGTVSVAGTLSVIGGGLARIKTGGTLEQIAPNGVISAIAPLTYEVGSTLRYSGTGAIMSGAELPSILPANLNVNNVGTLTCGAGVILQGTSTIGTASVMQIASGSGQITDFVGSLTLNGIIRIPPGINTLKFSGPLSLNGSIDGAFLTGNSNLQFVGSGSVTGALGFLGNTYRGAVLLDRPGMRLTLGSSLSLTNNTLPLTLTQGVLVTSAANLLTITLDFFDSILGGNANAYIDGPLARRLRANWTMPDSWLFPVGKNGRYLPVSIVTPQTGGIAPLIQAEAFTGATGGTADSTLNNLLPNTYWDVNLVSGNILSTRIRLDRDVPTIPLNAVVAKSPTLTGSYTSIGRDSVSATRIVSAPFSSFSTFTLGSPFIPPPPVVTIATVSPLIATQGTTVVITGANFSTVTGVFFGGQPAATFMVNSTTHITALVGNGASGRVTVRTSGFSSATTNTQFTFIGAPTITDIQPRSVLPNQDFVITGTNFFTTTNASQGASLLVSMNGNTASSVIINSPTQLTVRFIASGSGMPTLRAQGGITTSPVVVSIFAPPVITSFAPTTVPQNSMVTITGANFVVNQTQVRLNNLTLPVMVNSTSLATVQIPQNALSGTLSLTTPGGIATTSQTLTVVPAPSISSITPTSGDMGTPITITGQNLAASGTLLIGGIPTTFTGSGNVLTAILPTLPNNVVSSQATVSFQTLGGTAIFPQSITIFLPTRLAITGLEPNPTVEGLSMLIRLAGATANTVITNVSIGGVAATNATLQQTNGTVRLTTPTGIVMPLSARQVQAPVLISFTQNGRASSTNAAISLTVQAANFPALTSFSPQTGSSTTTLTLTGENFGSAPRGSIQAVLVGGVRVQSFRIVSPNQIQATVGTVMSGAVTVETSAGVLSAPGVFTFDARTQPVIVPEPPVATQDSLALIALYNATSGAAWRTNTGWQTTRPLRTWFGVVVANARVVELRLPANALQGTLPVQALRALANAPLSNLRVLDLSGNTISGDVANLFPLLTALESLNLSNTQLSGALANICSATNLRSINLANARFAGTLDALCCLNRMESLNVGNNQFTGALPACLGDKQTLTVIEASNNQLSGALPSGLGASEGLQVLNLRGNRLTGGIPATWGDNTAKNRTTAQSLTGLQRLDLSQNQLSGALPSEWSGLQNVRELLLAGNRFTGAIPTSFLALSRLRLLDVSNNQLSDGPDLGTISRLDTLAVGGNRFPVEVLERFAGQRSTRRIFTYLPQEFAQPRIVANGVDAPPTFTAVVNDPFRLSVAQPGAFARSTWRRNGQVVRTVGDTSRYADFRVSSFALSDTGVYDCVITNELLPEIILTTATVRILGRIPIILPSAVRLLTPLLGEEDLGRTPNFSWTSSQHAAIYRIECDSDARFTTLVSTATVPQSAAILAEGRFLATPQTLPSLYASGSPPSGFPPSGFPLLADRQYFWRVRAENMFGVSDWVMGNFITAPPDASVAVTVLDLGKTALNDTARGTLIVRNLGESTLTLESVVADSADFIIEPVRVGTVLLRGGELRLGVSNRARRVGTRFSAVTVRFRAGLSSTLQTRTLANRISLRVSGVKIIPPVIDTVIVNRQQVSTALFANLSDEAITLKNAYMLDADGPYRLRAIDRGRSIAPRDTITLLVETTARQVGLLPPDQIRCIVLYGNATADTRDQADTVEATIRGVEASLSGVVARDVRREDVFLRVGIRAVQDSVAPGGAVTLEVYLAQLSGGTGEVGGFQQIIRAAQPTFSGTLRWNPNVLQLAPNERGVRPVRMEGSTTATLRTFTIPTTFWSGRTSTLLTLQARVVAGNTDVTPLELETFRWGAGTVFADSLESSTFTAKVCTAGGKRLVTSAKATQLAAIAPNPAKDEVSIPYTLREDGFVEIALVDMHGKTAQLLLSEEQTAGEYTITKALKNVPSGAYTVRLSTQNGVVTKRVSVVR